MSAFPLFTPDPAPMVGRARIFKRIVDALIKKTPQSVSLVGPRYFGKSVILSEVAKDPAVATAYSCVIQWDLGHQIPQSDAEFITILKKKLSDALVGKNDDISKHLANPDAGYVEILESLELLEVGKERILMIWDGVDPTIGSGRLTRNLWDNLLALGRKDSLVLLLSSRRKLQELIRDAESVTSDFWQIFEVISLEPMDKSDLDAFAAKMGGYVFQPGSLTELMNWTNGIPPLVISLLNQIGDSNPSGEVPASVVNFQASEPQEQRSDMLEEIWSDLGSPAADLYRALVTGGTQNYAILPKKERSALAQAGLMVNESGTARPVCKLMREHIGVSNPEFGALASMFGTWESYRANIRGILERRMAQIHRNDDTLCHMVDRAIEDLPLHPSTSLHSLSGIEDRAFELIWYREFGTARRLTTEVISYWTQSPRDRHRFVAERMESDSHGRANAWEIPTERTPQLTLLQLLTASHQDFRQRTCKFVSKDTYVLLNAIHSFRNRSQHSGGEVIELGVAVSAVMLCVELLACLSRELRDE